MEPQSEKFDIFEDEVRSVMGVPDAPQGFLLTLRQRVLGDPQARAATSRKGLLTPVPLWSAVVTLVIAVVLAIGPTKVFAALEEYIGYVSGVGFVNTRNALAMKAPLTEDLGGRVLHVDQLVSSDTDTVLVLRWNSFGSANSSMQGPYVALIDATGKALLPTSQFVRPISGTIDPDVPAEYMGTYHFKTLARRTRSVDLFFQEAEKWPPYQAASHEMRVSLYPISDPDVARLLPSSYAPEGASAEAHGIRLSVEMVSSSPTETGIKTLLTFPSEFTWMSPNSPQLIDSSGRAYYPDWNMNTYGPWSTTTQAPSNSYLTFDVPYFPHDSPTLTLLAEYMFFSVASDAHYSIEIPQDAKVGDTWPIHKRLVYGGVSFEVEQARVAKLRLDDPNTVGIVLDIVGTNPSLVPAVHSVLAVNGQAANYADDDPNQWLGPCRTPKFTLETLPRGKVDITIADLSGNIAGPWKIEWNSEVP